MPFIDHDEFKKLVKQAIKDHYINELVERTKSTQTDKCEFSLNEEHNQFNSFIKKEKNFTKPDNFDKCN